MKTTTGSPGRDALQTTLYRGGAFTYEYISDFAKNLPVWMDNLNGPGAFVAGGCTDAEGSVYLTVRGAPYPIVKLDSEGNFVKGIGRGLFQYIHFVCATPWGTLLAADVPAHNILELDPDGALVRKFTDGTPSDSGQERWIWKRLRRQGGFYPTEPENINDDKFQFYAALRSTKRCAPPFNSPTDAAVDSRGNIYISDGYGNCAVHKFSRDGRLLKTWGGVGSWEENEQTPGKFLVVHALCVDAQDRIWVCDREKDAVHIFDCEGNVVGYTSGSLGQPSGVDCDGEYVYVIGRGGYLTVYDMNMEIAAQLGTFNCDLRAHDLCTNRRGDIFLFPTHANPDHQVICLKRVRSAP